MKRANTSRPPLARMQRIHDMLVIGAHVTASRIAEELEVSARTAQRDIDFMRDTFCLPIEYEPMAHTFLYREPVASVLFGVTNLGTAQPPQDFIKRVIKRFSVACRFMWFGSPRVGTSRARCSR